VLGRDLHKFLESNEAYTNWFKRMVEYCFEENRDFVQINISSESDFTGIDQRFVRPKYNHQLTLDMAKEISMIQRNEKGKQARQYFIECEKILKDGYKELSKMKKSELLYQAYKYQKKVEEVEELLELQKPKVETYDRAVSLDFNYSFTEVSHVLGLSKHDLAQWLVDRGILSRKCYEGKNKTCYKYIPLAPYYQEPKRYVVRKIMTPDGEKAISSARVTVDGIKHICNEMEKDSEQVLAMLDEN
jgi:anti-repressor protein